MAERPDSVATLATINVPTLIIAGDEDSVPLSEFELMRQQISGSGLRVISHAGHYAALEKPEEFGALLRKFFDNSGRARFQRWFALVTCVTLIRFRPSVQ